MDSGKDTEIFIEHFANAVIFIEHFANVWKLHFMKYSLHFSITSTIREHLT